jgi:thiol:disulfide interchange protein
MQFESRPFPVSAPQKSVSLHEGRDSLRDRVSRRALFSMVAAAAVISSTQSRQVLASPDRAPAFVATNEAEFSAALAEARKVVRAALVDIGAEWCPFCRTIEREILPHPSIGQLMQRIALVKVDVTAMDHGNKRLLQHLRADGPPTLFVVDTVSGREYPGTRSVGTFAVIDLVRRLSPFWA